MSVGKPLPHDSAPLHVTGTARYADDEPLPAGALHLAFGLSPSAAGRVAKMDLDAVRAAPGVALVMTADDLPFANDVSPSAHDEPLLSDGTVHYMGQPLFLVAATSHLAARKAVRLADVEIEEETPVLTVDEALAAGDRHFDGGPRVWSRGDPEGTMTGRTVEGTIEIGGQEHFYLEGQSAYALPGEDEMVVRSSSQHPTEIQHKVADALGAAMNAVRVEVRRMGGGFGGKESQGNALAVACAVVARATGRPAKMRYDRDDDMVVTGKRHDMRVAYRAAFDGEGRVTAVDFTHLVRCGWAQDLSLPVADRAMLHADNAYWLPNVRITSHRLRTNTQSATAFRGFGGPQGMLGIERVMDHVAHELGMDPVEVRRRNYYRPAEAPLTGAAPGGGDGTLKAPEAPLDAETDVASRGAVGHIAEPSVAADAGPQTTPYGMPVTDFALHEMTDWLLAASRYAERRAEIEAFNEAQPLIRRGIAFSPVKFGISFTLTHLNQAGALVHVYQDGSVHLNHGGTEMGQGLHSKVAQVAASRFGLTPDRVRITATDTGKVPNTSATAASSGADLNGMAVKAACDTIRGRMAEFLAGLHQAKPSEIVFADGEVRVGAETMPFEEAVRLSYVNRVQLSATGFYATPDIVWDRDAGRGRPFYYFAHGCAVTEVALDTLTGENRILRADLLHDAGASLNPALDIGQVEGGYVQGAGWLTTEELVWDDKGRLTTHAPSTYKIPAFSDRPRIFNVALHEGENREETIYRSKAVGEPPFMLGISAFLALSQAASVGPNYPALDAPATAEELWRAMERSR